jgi:2-polyprenyl-6-hydroxyphenyl methylase/3-demethylubiquinone-9 3-methyltransferase
LRLAWIERVVGGLEGKRVVDVGCGGGILSESLAARGADVTGIDLSEKALGVAKLHKLESGAAVDYRLVAAEELAQDMPGAFDLVACMEMIEHVPDPASTVAACAKLVRPGGNVIFSTINRNPKSYLFAIVGAEYVLKLLPRGTHDWSRFIRPAELARFGRQAGIRLVETTGIVYNPLTKAFRLDATDLDVNYIAAFHRDA